MATSSSARRFALPWPLAALFAAASVALPSACSSDDDAPSAPAAGAGSSTGGTGSQAGTPSSAGASARSGTGGAGGSNPSNAGGSSSAGGSASSVGGASNVAGKGGGASNVGGKSSGSGGGGALGGSGGRTDPPKPNDDGSSPYERECHGDTIECDDVEVLRCLGIRDDSTIYGYSCSNTCETDADCSDAPASGEAQAGCVDFVTQKHCLLVCLSDGKTHSCPDGMGCYVYPQSPIGYCLWQ